MSNALKIIGYVGFVACLILFGVVGVPVNDPLPTIVAYAAVGLGAAGALWLSENLDR